MAKVERGDCWIDNRKNVAVVQVKPSVGKPKTVCADGVCSDPKWPGKSGGSAKR
jgi:hypothetical protein